MKQFCCFIIVSLLLCSCTVSSGDHSPVEYRQPSFEALETSISGDSLVLACRINGNLQGISGSGFHVISSAGELLDVPAKPDADCVMRASVAGLDYFENYVCESYLANGSQKMLSDQAHFCFNDVFVEIPDAELRTLISEDCDMNKDGRLSHAELLQFTKLDLSVNTNVKNLSGIEHCFHLNCIQIVFDYDNPCSDSDFLTPVIESSFPYLQTLFLSQCSLENKVLDLTRYPMLTGLTLHNTGIRRVDLRPVANLRSFASSDPSYSGHPEEIIFPQMDQMTFLQMEFIKYSDFDFSKSPSLIELDLNYNKVVTELDLRPCTALKILRVYKCSSLKRIRLPKSLQNTGFRIGTLPSGTIVSYE